MRPTPTILLPCISIGFFVFLNGPLGWVSGINCWQCNRCQGDPNRSDITTGQLVICPQSYTCWIYLYEHGPPESPKIMNNTNTHRLCGSRKSNPPENSRRCIPVTGMRGLRGFQCQCNEDACNMDLKLFKRAKSPNLAHFQIPIIFPLITLLIQLLLE